MTWEQLKGSAQGTEPQQLPGGIPYVFPFPAPHVSNAVPITSIAFRLPQTSLFPSNT